jgi:hypothetical protein
MGRRTEQPRKARPLKPRWWPALALAGTVILAAALAACGSSTPSAGNTGTSGSSQVPASACVAKAQAFLKGYSEPPTSLPPELKPLSRAPKTGGTIIRMYNTNSPSDVEVQNAVEAAAATAGWKASGLAYNGSIADLQNKLAEAISKKPNAIMTPAGIEPGDIASSIAAAKAAGILVAIGYVTTPPNEIPGFGAASVTPATQQTVAKIAADWVMADSNCKANVETYNLAGYAMAKLGADAFQNELTANCPACTVSYNEVPITQIGTPALTQTITSTLQAKPSTGYLFLTLGNLNDGLPAALRQAGLGKVKILGLVPDSSSIQGLAQKTNSMWVDDSAVMLGWIQVDAVFRALNSNAVTSDNVLPGIYAMTQDNINGATQAPTYPSNYAQLFKQLWKVG